MGVIDRQVWEDTIFQWNHDLYRLHKPKSIQAALVDALAASGCVYRFASERFQARRHKFEQVRVSRPYTRRFVSRAHEVIEVPLVTPLRPAFLPPLVGARLNMLGKELEQLLQLSNEFLLENKDIISFFGSPIKGEFSWIEANRSLSPISQWMRVDYLWSWNGSNIDIRLVDINLLPGMTFVNSVLARQFVRVFSEQGLCKSDVEDRLFDTGPLLLQMLAAFRLHRHTPAEKLKLAVLTRPYHGLSSDAEIAASQIKLASGVEVQVTSPSELEQQIADHQLNGVIRMARPVSKHGTAATREVDDLAFARLSSIFRDQMSVYPAFTSYLENHSWFYFWRTPAFQRFASHRGYEEILHTLLPLIPPTAIIGPNRQLLGLGEQRELIPQDLADRVLKRGNSTGGQDLRVFYRASSGQLSHAFTQIQSELDAGWVLQDRVPTPKESYPIFESDSTDSLVLVPCFMVYAAYYSSGSYLGGHALMTPSSRKVHGGFDTYISPILPIP